MDSSRICFPLCPSCHKFRTLLKFHSLLCFRHSCLLTRWRQDAEPHRIGIGLARILIATIPGLCAMLLVAQWEKHGETENMVLGKKSHSQPAQVSSHPPAIHRRRTHAGTWLHTSIHTFCASTTHHVPSLLQHTELATNQATWTSGIRICSSLAHWVAQAWLYSTWTEAAKI